MLPLSFVPLQLEFPLAARYTQSCLPLFLVWCSAGIRGDYLHCLESICNPPPPLLSHLTSNLISIHRLVQALTDCCICYTYQVFAIWHLSSGDRRILHAPPGRDKTIYLHKYTSVACCTHNAHREFMGPSKPISPHCCSHQQPTAFLLRPL